MKIESKMIAKSKNSARQYVTEYIRGMETGDIYSIHRSHSRLLLSVQIFHCSKIKDQILIINYTHKMWVPLWAVHIALASQVTACSTVFCFFALQKK